MINACVIDTDVLSYIFKSDTQSRSYLYRNLGLVSSMTLAELRQWSLVKGWGERRLRELDQFIGRYHIIYSDDSLCSIWAEIRRDALKFGNPIGIADAWVAAAALLYGVPLVTHNRSHFAGVRDLIVVSEA